MFSLRTKLVSVFLIQGGLLAWISLSSGEHMRVSAGLAATAQRTAASRAQSLRIATDVDRIQGEGSDAEHVVQQLASLESTWHSQLGAELGVPSVLAEFGELVRAVPAMREQLRLAGDEVEGLLAPLALRIVELDVSAEDREDDEAAMAVVAEIRRCLGRLQGSHYRYAASVGEDAGEQALLVIMLTFEELDDYLLGLREGDSDYDLSPCEDDSGLAAIAAAQATLADLRGSIERNVARNEAGAQLLVRLRGAANRLDSELADAVDRAQEAWMQSGLAQQKAQRLMIGVAGGVLVLVLVLLLRNVIRPLRRMVRTMSNIADGDRDLSQRIQSRRKDELGQFATGFNAFIAKIHDTVTAVNAGIDELDGAAKDLDLVVENLRRGSADNRNWADRLASTGDQVEAAVNATTVASRELTEEGRTVAEGSRQVRTISVDAVEMVSGVDASLARLTEHGQEIGKVTEMISTLARETNMLALNAAIEAARAGAAGQGFAVVADEVRRLAMRTASEASSIDAAIVAMREDMVQASDAMAQARTTVDEIHRLQECVGSEVERQGETIQLVDHHVMVVREGSTTIQEVSTAVVSGTDVADSLSADTSMLAKRVSGIAEQLEGLVGQFKL